MTRDMIQGFIDGYKAAGGTAQPGNGLQIVVSADPTQTTANPIVGALSSWMTNHPIYPQDQQTVNIVLSDLGSYRV